MLLPRLAEGESEASFASLSRSMLSVSRKPSSLIRSRFKSASRGWSSFGAVVRLAEPLDAAIWGNGSAPNLGKLVYRMALTRTGGVGRMRGIDYKRAPNLWNDVIGSFVQTCSSVLNAGGRHF